VSKHQFGITGVLQYIFTRPSKSILTLYA